MHDADVGSGVASNDDVDAEDVPKIRCGVVYEADTRGAYDGTTR